MGRSAAAYLLSGARSVRSWAPSPHADVVLVTEIYAAREAPPDYGLSARRLVAAMPHRDDNSRPRPLAGNRFLTRWLAFGGCCWYCRRAMPTR